MSSELIELQTAQRLSNAGRWTQQWVIGLGLVIAVVIFYASTFLSMIAIWNRDSSFTHGYLIPVLSAWLLWRDRQSLMAQPITPAPVVLGLVAALCVIWLCASFADIHVLQQAAATALIPCALWTILGTRWTRQAAFPLAYLMFAVPFGDFLVPSLVKFTTEFTVAAVQLVGVPIYREGASFSLPSGSFEVVKACSGVRYLIATIALGTLFAALTYRSWRRRLLFMAICLVFPVIANGLRAFGIVMIAHYSQMKYAVGIDHLIYGWLFFGLVMWILFWIGSTFADRPIDADQPLVNQSNISVRWSPKIIGALLLILAVGPVSSFAWRASAAMPIAIEKNNSLQLSSDWSGPTAATVGWQPAFSLAQDAIRTQYKNARGTVNLFVRSGALGIDGAARLSTPLVDEMQLDWRSESTGLHRVDTNREVDTAIVVGHSNSRWRVWRWYYVDGVFTAAPTQTKLLQLHAWLQHRQPMAMEVSITTTIGEPSPTDIAAADQLLNRFVENGGWQLASINSAASSP